MNLKRKQVKSETWKGVKSVLSATYGLRVALTMLSLIATGQTVYAVESNPTDFAASEDTDETETTIIPLATAPVVTDQVSVTTKPITTRIIPVTTTSTTTTTVTTSVKEDDSTETQTEIKEEVLEEYEEYEEYIEEEVVAEDYVVEEETEVVSENEPVKECTIEGEPEYMSDEYMLAYAMAREAADYQDAEYVGSVVLNRVADWEFPDTIIGVLEDSRFCKQYSWAYGNYPREDIYDDYFFEIARKLLNEGSSLPQGVIFQSQLVLGEIYLQYGVHYYCFR